MVAKYIITTTVSPSSIPSSTRRKLGALDSMVQGKYHPQGVAVTQDDHILVADKNYHHLQVLTAECAFNAKWAVRDLNHCNSTVQNV